MSIFLYVFESWSLAAVLETRRQAFEMRYYRRFLPISYKDHVTNEETPDLGQETNTETVRPRLKVFWWLSKDGSIRQSEEKMYTEEVGRELYGVDRGGLCYFN